MTIELTHQITDIKGINQLYAIASRVIGETCWKATLSYGDELTLHFGEQIPYTHPSMAGKHKGSWILGTRGTAWQLNNPSDASATLDTKAAMLDIFKRELRQLEGNILQSLKIDYPVLGLTLNFSQGIHLTITPPVRYDEFDLPYWELFTPDHQVLQVGPQSSWSLIQSDRSPSTPD
ncbi:MAG: hypothetical protein KME45_06575 [Stenomitos rutilans HA7619-LM2]|jgi:hypothetical protein|nr:hypothetical protein [Stenomitos rutilans HA7619-LM2]